MNIVTDTPWSSTTPSQLSSTRLHTSGKPGWTLALLSSQSASHESPLQQRASTKPSRSLSRNPYVVGSQSSSMFSGGSQTSVLLGNLRASRSSQSSPPHSMETCPSPSASASTSQRRGVQRVIDELFRATHGRETVAERTDRRDRSRVRPSSPSPGLLGRLRWRVSRARRERRVAWVAFLRREDRPTDHVQDDDMQSAHRDQSGAGAPRRCSRVAGARDHARARSSTASGPRAARAANVRSPATRGRRKGPRPFLTRAVYQRRRLLSPRTRSPRAIIVIRRMGRHAAAPPGWRALPRRLAS